MNRSMYIKKNMETGKYELEIRGEFNEVRELKRYAIRRRYDGSPMELGDLEKAFSSNLSSEYTTLIQTAGRFCEYYASDILYDIQAVEKDLADSIAFLNGETDVRKQYLFGFRKDGVDHKEFVLSQIQNYGDRTYHFYRAVYELEVHMFLEDEGKYLTVEVGFARID